MPFLYRTSIDYSPAVSCRTIDLSRQRAINMLQSNEPELMRAGASTVVANYAKDRQVTDLVRAVLLARYKDAENDIQLAEALAWFCKVLGTSGQGDYVGALQEVKSSTQQSAIKRWSDNALDMLKQH